MFQFGKGEIARICKSAEAPADFLEEASALGESREFVPNSTVLLRKINENGIFFPCFLQ